MIKEILVGEMFGKNRIPGPVEIKMGSILGNEFGHTDMIISVGIKKCRYRKLSEDNHGYPDQECRD